MLHPHFRRCRDGNEDTAPREQGATSRDRPLENPQGIRVASLGKHTARKPKINAEGDLTAIWLGLPI